jgi:hypothetical protein
LLFQLLYRWQPTKAAVIDMTNTGYRWRQEKLGKRKRKREKEKEKKKKRARGEKSHTRYMPRLTAGIACEKKRKRGAETDHYWLWKKANRFLSRRRKIKKMVAVSNDRGGTLSNCTSTEQQHQHTRLYLSAQG